jgi:hypothetical protein
MMADCLLQITDGTAEKEKTPDRVSIGFRSNRVATVRLHFFADVGFPGSWSARQVDCLDGNMLKADKVGGESAACQGTPPCVRAHLVGREVNGLKDFPVATFSELANPLDAEPLGNCFAW